MGLTKTTVGVTNISDLSSTPNATEGLTAAQLQAKFDKTGADLKTYINDTLTVEQDAINAKLDSVTKFLTATAVTNGDYKVNITNALATGMILNIAFPAATNAASNARLSIDNGVNYKNIYDINGVQLKAAKIENKKLQLIYDGTNFVAVIMQIEYDLVTGGSAVPAGYKVDGKPVYVKRINFGSLPNATTKNVDTGIAKATYTILDLCGIANNGSTFLVKLPNLSTAALANCISIGIDTTGTNYQIQITAGIDRTAWSAIVDIYYYTN